MAEDNDQERTEEPTAKRLEDSRKQGQIPRSRELNTLAVLMAGVVGMLMFGSGLLHDLREVMLHDIRLSQRDAFDPEAPLAHLAYDLGLMLEMLWPLLALGVLAALLGPLALGGWNFTSENLGVKLDKLNPLPGIARMFSAQAAVEAAKAIIKFLLVGFVTAGLFMHHLDDFVGLGRLDFLPAAGRAMDLVLTCLLWLCASLVLIAAVDVPFQLWSWKRKLRMTLQEIKDEMRDAEGKPEVKSRIRGLQMEMARRRMMEEVPKADVVITNPSHYAVALKYDAAGMAAPKVVAKGVDLIAAQIRNLALGAEVPLVAAPPLARALHASTELDQEIPQALYLAVAQVLAYVYQLRDARRHGGSGPEPLGDIEVPEEYARS
ncbi:flagellar biosynthetic protein FlhB [Methylomagnum ishizawai]|uniref:Flagellar biosynthetic protein FlhB n=1 Tax=Methylomagnum ishizawai TaxID=1760988 RepID=A0A1Y6CSZ3_9GAMM|nr:flagellar biosynthesis protein FlhB [Methylomagnum ishizawai]SMF93718.1 flagellar biosynthetic protein FlhB [Methylomagnum ishizawai]